MATQSSGERTKLLIADSLRKLMKKKSLDKIKIREIVEDCGVNRQTFYYHFQDIYALVEWIYTYDGRRIVDDHKNDPNWNGIIIEMFEYLEEHHEEIRSVVNSKADKFFHDFIYEKVGTVIRIAIDTASKDMKVQEGYKEFIVEFYTYAICGVVEAWMKNRNASKISSEELIRMFTLTIKGNIQAALVRCEAESLQLIQENNS